MQCFLILCGRSQPVYSRLLEGHNKTVRDPQPAVTVAVSLLWVPRPFWPWVEANRQKLVGLTQQ